ncbi:MAG TPA: glycosyltransferase family 1 protein [Gaiellaceae bacterium]|nr:glycosyltransferase family 1 protein [Gaiellaceae bacterium]
MIVLDADVLGRNRTGEETYLRNLLRELPQVAPDLHFGAVTRRVELLPEGIEPLTLPARSQEVRMAWTLPRLLRHVRPQVAHFQHALPLGYRGRSVVTLHDLHFERDPRVMARADRVTFKLVVPRSARRAGAVVAVSERTKRDAVELYGLPPDRIAVAPHGVDPAFSPGDGSRDYALFVGAVQARKDPLAALAAASAVGLPLVVAGPEKEPALAAELRAGGADLRGWVDVEELARLYRGAAAVLLPSRYEGFGLPALEAMASGTPVVLSADPALREVAADAGVYAEEGDLAGALRRALDERERYVQAGLERAKRFSWRETARRTADVYRSLL